MSIIAWPASLRQQVRQTPASSTLPKSCRSGKARIKQGILEAVSTLADVYRATNQRDSIIKYLEMSVALNKELFTREKEREIQFLSFNEQLRRQEKEQAEMLAAEERKKNLQLLAIAAFIITFMVGVIVISRKKSFLKTARFLGLIGVLLIFEFISLLTHTWIEKISHSPVLTLLILVLLASILVPVHHYLENMIKKKLVKQRRPKRTKRINTAQDTPKTG